MWHSAIPMQCIYQTLACKQYIRNIFPWYVAHYISFTVTVHNSLWPTCVKFLYTTL